MYPSPEVHRTDVSEFPDGHLRAVAVGLGTISALRMGTGQTVALEWSPGLKVSPGHWGLHYGFVAPRHTAGLLSLQVSLNPWERGGSETAWNLPEVTQRMESNRNVNPGLTPLYTVPAVLEKQSLNPGILSSMKLIL